MTLLTIKDFFDCLRPVELVVLHAALQLVLRQIGRLQTGLDLIDWRRTGLDWGDRLRASLERARLERADLDPERLARQEQARQKQVGQKQARQKQVGQEQARQEQVGQKQARQEQVDQEQVGQKQVGQKQVGQEQVGQKQVGQKQVDQDQACLEQVNQELERLERELLNWTRPGQASLSLVKPPPKSRPPDGLAAAVESVIFEAAGRPASRGASPTVADGAALDGIRSDLQPGPAVTPELIRRLVGHVSTQPEAERLAQSREISRILRSCGDSCRDVSANSGGGASDAFGAEERSGGASRQSSKPAFKKASWRSCGNAFGRSPRPGDDVVSRTGRQGAPQPGAPEAAAPDGFRQVRDDDPVQRLTGQPSFRALVLLTALRLFMLEELDAADLLLELVGADGEDAEASGRRARKPRPKAPRSKDSAARRCKARRWRRRGA
jgi:hypothetical protein